MKIITLLIVLITCAQTSKAQTPLPDEFIGHWENKDWYERSIYSDFMVVTKDTAKLILFESEDKEKVYVVCKPKYANDTMFLYTAYVDSGARQFENFVMPRHKSLFAKCYLAENALHIIYTHKWFIKNISEFKLDTVVYKFAPGASTGRAITSKQKNFYGTWYEHTSDDDAFPVFEIASERVNFMVLVNQLYLVCKPKFEGDTLLLYIKYIDCGRMFFPGNYPLPKFRSLFAKCYMKGNQIHIIYTQKLFRNHIKDFDLSTIVKKHHTTLNR